MTSTSTMQGKMLFENKILKKTASLGLNSLGNLATPVLRLSNL